MNLRFEKFSDKFLSLIFQQNYTINLQTGSRLTFWPKLKKQH
jgi:hypothetical protein